MQLPKNWHETHKNQLSLSERIANRITDFSGSMKFVYVHIVWWTFWFIINAAFLHITFDPYPYQLLTMLLSLEAILLSTFIMISQNLQGDRDRIQAEHDRQVAQATFEELEIVKKINAEQNEILKSLHEELLQDDGEEL